MGDPEADPGDVRFSDVVIIGFIAGIGCSVLFLAVGSPIHIALLLGIASGIGVYVAEYTIVNVGRILARYLRRIVDRG